MRTRHISQGNITTARLGSDIVLSFVERKCNVVLETSSVIEIGWIIVLSKHTWIMPHAFHCYFTIFVNLFRTAWTSPEYAHDAYNGGRMWLCTLESYEVLHLLEGKIFHNSTVRRPIREVSTKPKPQPQPQPQLWICFQLMNNRKQIHVQFNIDDTQEMIPRARMMSFPYCETPPPI